MDRFITFKTDLRKQVIHKRFRLARQGEKWLYRFRTEVNCLKKLEANFIPHPNVKHYPFPKLISVDEDTHSVITSYCGINALDNSFTAKRRRTKNKIQPVNLKNTVECIISNLDNNRIIHNDITNTNVCIDKNGNVSLIDFEVSIYELPIPKVDDDVYEYVSTLAKKGLINKEDTKYIRAKLVMYENVKDLTKHYNKMTKETLDELENQIKDLRFINMRDNPWSILYMFNR